MPGSLSVRILDADIATRLTRRAARNGRSTEAEVRAILAAALADDSPPDFDRLAADLRGLLAGRFLTPAEVLLRESRDER